jgi:mediator of replication checkpoint protein 1
MLDFIDGDVFVPDSQVEESQTAAAPQPSDVERPALSNISTNIPAKPARGPAATTTTLKRPTTLEEIRDSVGAFFDDPIVPDSQPPPPPSDDDEAEHDSLPALSRTDTSVSVGSAASGRGGIVNRLLRASASAEDSARGGPLAFAAKGSAAAAEHAPAFKMPSLLRRSTTSLSATSSKSSTSSSRSRVVATTASAVRVGGSKKSNMHYQAYEAERKRAVEQAERKRKQQLKKTVMATKGRGIMGMLRAKGSGFE